METEKCTTALGSEVMRQPCRQEDGARANKGESRNERERRKDKEKERDSAAPNVIMQWTGSANGGGMFVLYFSAGEVTRRRASLVPNSGAGPRYRTTSERHTHTGVDKAGVC